MNILCRIFGHQPPTSGRKGWYSPGEEYARIDPKYGERDGLGVRHRKVLSECPRCGVEFRLCRIHLPHPSAEGRVMIQDYDTTVRVRSVEKGSVIYLSGGAIVNDNEGTRYYLRDGCGWREVNKAEFELPEVKS